LCSAETILGRSLSEFSPESPLTYDAAADIVREAVRGKAVIDLELEMQREDGKRIWASISSRPFTSGTGVPTEIGLTAVDITRRKNMEERLRAESQRANLYMEVMTQDLNLVNQNVLFALEDLSISIDLPDRLKNLMSETAWSLRRAARMIANMGVLISLDQEPPEKTKTPLKPHFDKAIREATRDFAWKTITVKSEVTEKDLDVAAHAFIWYAFFNIIHHSASADSREEVKIDLKASLDESGELVRVELLDRSPGIPDELKSEIFRREGAAQDELHGSGLGLTVVDRYVTDLGGEIWVEDRVKGKPEKGSKFVLLLPVYKEEIAIPPILYYKSEHCVFCNPVLDSLEVVLKEMGISTSAIEIVNVDDPDSEVTEGDLPALPTIRLGKNELAGYQSEEDLRTAIMSMIFMSGG
jgi:PAS domain S-box-containing protein